MMAGTLLFTDDPATDIGYCNVRAAGDEHMRRAREHCELLLKMHEP